MTYVFINIITKSVYGYTSSKKIAKDFIAIHNDKIKLIKSDDFKHNPDDFPMVNSNDEIVYYMLHDSKKSYLTPMTLNEISIIEDKCVNINIILEYSHGEFSSNDYDLKSKYLNIIDYLTNELNYDYEFLYGYDNHKNIMGYGHYVDYSHINTFGMYIDMFREYLKI